MSTSYSLRDLPLPVKVVATVFLLAVGAGYTSAMLQLHIQDSKSGEPMPSVADVVLKFTGKKKFDPNAPPPAAPVSRLEALVTAETVDITGATMSAAFTTQDRAPKALKFAEQIKTRPKAEVEAERKGEQAAFALWIRTPDQERKAAYEADRFVPPAGKAPAALTAQLKDGDAVKIKTLIEVRCVACHAKGGEKEDPALDTYAGLVKFMPADAGPPKVVNGYVKVEEPISISKLTQSTHAHLLSFAVLFSLTGLIFAFSSYPTALRVILGPWVVIAVFADVGMWWLARLCDEMGPRFAMAVIGTGAAAGVGLGLQIVLGLLNMYGWKGKIVILALFAAGAAGGGFFVTKLLVPALPKPKIEEKKPDEPKPDGKKEADKNGTKLGAMFAAAGGALAEGAGKPQTPVAVAPRKPANEIDRLLTWPPVDAEGRPVDPDEVKFAGDGTMVPAFFEKDKKYSEFVKDAGKTQAEKDKLKAERQGDLDALVAWARAPEAARKGAYDSNTFDLPGLSDRTVTPDFVKDGKVLIKTLIDNRCATCHKEGGKQEDYPLTSYKELSQYLKPFDAPAPKDNGKAAPAPAPQPAPVPPAPEPQPDAPAVPAPRPVTGPTGKGE